MTETAWTASVKLFARAKELQGGNEVLMEMKGSIAFPKFLELFKQSYPMLASLDGRIAVNLEFADEHTQIQPEDEIAFLPPVSGG